MYVGVFMCVCGSVLGKICDVDDLTHTSSELLCFSVSGSEALEVGECLVPVVKVKVED